MRCFRNCKDVSIDIMNALHDVRLLLMMSSLMLEQPTKQKESSYMANILLHTSVLLVSFGLSCVVRELLQVFVNLICVLLFK